MPLTLDGNGDITGLVTGALPSTVIGAGAVLQVVSATYSTGVYSVTTSYTDTGLSTSITPTSSTSKILVLVSQQVTVQGGGTDSGAQIRILRGASEIFATATTGVYIYNPTSGTELKLYLSFNYLDSPATTSSTTYKLQGRDSSFGSSVQFQDNNSPSLITLMEIAA